MWERSLKFLGIPVHPLERSKIPTLYLQKFDGPYKAVVCPLVLTEKVLSLDLPEAIIEALNEIARLCVGSQAVPVPSPKRKVISDITNHIDVLPVAGIQCRGKQDVLVQLKMRKLRHLDTGGEIR
jgi:hypothetical protein